MGGANIRLSKLESSDVSAS